MAQLFNYTSLNLSLAEASPVPLLSMPITQSKRVPGNQQRRIILALLGIQLVPEQTNANILRIQPDERHTCRDITGSTWKRAVDASLTSEAKAISPIPSPYRRHQHRQWMN